MIAIISQESESWDLLPNEFSAVLVSRVAG